MMRIDDGNQKGKGKGDLREGCFNRAQHTLRSVNMTIGNNNPGHKESSIVDIEHGNRRRIMRIMNGLRYSCVIAVKC